MALLDVKLFALDRVGGAHLVAHADDFSLQGLGVARRRDDGFADGVKALLERVVAQHKTGARHGLVFPGPGGVRAALLLVVGVSVKRGDQQAGVAVRAQRGVDLVQVAFAGFDGQPVDQLAHQVGIDLGCAFVVVGVDKHDVQVAAVAEFLAAKFAVGNDGQLGRLAMFVFQAAPAPAGGDAQHRLGQGAEVVGYFFDAQFAFDVARQRAKHFGVVGAAQQVEQGFVVVFAAAGQRGAPVIEFQLEVAGRKAFIQHVGTGQFVNHAGVQQQVARRPARGPQQTQQALMHIGALQQQGQVAFSPQQGFNPVGQAHGRLWRGAAFVNPLGGAGNQAHQAGARVFAQGQHPGVLAPGGDAGPKVDR